MAVLSRMRQAWNAFIYTNDPSSQPDYAITSSYGNNYRPDRSRLRYTNEKSIATAILTRISVDVAGVEFRHIMTEESGRYLNDMDSSLNTALNLEPNLDQGPRAFRQDIAMVLFDLGCSVIVPVDMTIEPQTRDIIDIYTLRVGQVVTWYPKHVKVSVYNENRGVRQEIVLEKRFVAIVENPLYSVMNQPNSTLQRLIRKLNLLDAVDEQSGAGKLDLIIQLPYIIKSESRKAQAEQRRKDIEFQLKGSQYGIAYTDGTEKITQLNRPTENNLMKQIEYLTTMLYGQLGITEEIMNGTADEKAMLNYYERTIKPVADAVAEAMRRTFIGPSKTEKIVYFKNPFTLVPLSEIAEIADKFTRNEILSSNEIRGFMGISPSKDPKADKLINSNMPQPTVDNNLVNGNAPQTTEASPVAVLRKESQNGA